MVATQEMLCPLRLTLFWPTPLSQGESHLLSHHTLFSTTSSTACRYVSWRNSEYGSWFIKAFVDTMKEQASREHFMDILTEVNRKVAYDFQSRGRNKQIPAPVTMLTRKLYFRPTGR